MPVAPNCSLLDPPLWFIGIYLHPQPKKTKQDTYFFLSDTFISDILNVTVFTYLKLVLDWTVPPTLGTSDLCYLDHKIVLNIIN